MFGMTIGKRTARGMAVGALILSISATTFGGSANAAPTAGDTTSCSTLAHARNDAVHTLHAAWKGFRDQLKDLAHQARELERDSRHSKSATEMTVDARSEVAAARAKLHEILTSAHEKLQNGVDLGQACADQDKDEDKDEDTKTSSTTANMTTTSATKKHEDADEDKDENKDEDKDDETKTTTASTTTGPSTAELVAKLKGVVDQAIKDMQAVLDDVTATVAKMTTAAQSTDASMAAKVKAERAKEKDTRNNEHGRGNGKGSRG